VNSNIYTLDGWRQQIRWDQPSLDFLDELYNHIGWLPEVVFFSDDQPAPLYNNVKNERINWLNEHLAGRFHIWNMFTVMFKRETDAMAFKLRWL